MAEKKKTPEIRFKGFTEEWEEKKILDRFKVTRGYVLAATKTSEVQSVNKPYPVYSSQTKDNGLMGYFKDFIYDTAITWTTDGANAGTVKFRDGKFYCTNVCGVLLSNEGYANEMVAEALNKIAWKHVSKVGNPKLMNNIMSEIAISLPGNIDEQIKVSEHFKILDALIALHQRKHDKLCTVKKAMLEKMFPKVGADVPEIRFKGFTGKWERRKLGETKSFFTDGNYGEAYPSDLDMTDEASGVPFLRGSNLSKGQLLKKGANYITKEKHLELASGHLLEDDIVLAVRGSLGALGYVKKDNVGWNINSQLAVIRTDKNELSGNFLIQYLLSARGQQELLSKITGSALKQLPIGQLKQINVLLASVKEQAEISTLFQHLDSLISLHQRELDKLKNIKKACLKKMFV